MREHAEHPSQWVAASMHSDLVLDAVEQALHEHRTDAQFIHHSGRGSQYPPIRYTERSAESGIERPSGVAAMPTTTRSPAW